MNSLRLYQCQVCQLKRELSLRKDSPDLYNCVMTKGCLGKVKLLGQRKGVRPKRYDVSIFSDFETRGFQAPIAAAAAVASHSSLESGPRVLTAGLVRRTVVGLNSIYEVPTGVSSWTQIETHNSATLLPDLTIVLELIELEPLAKNERRYVYAPNVTVFYIDGEDDSTLRRTLRVDPAYDEVKVIVDGIELDVADYTVSLDQITFNPALTDTSRIEVVVFREPELTTDNVLLLRFAKLARTDELRPTLAWGGSVGSTTDVGSLVSLFCTTLGRFNVTKTYIINRAYVEEQPLVELDLTRTVMLLGYKPYAFEDRRLDAFVKLSALKDEQFSIQRDDDGVLILKVAQAAFTQAVVPNKDYLPFSLFGDDTSSQATSIVAKAPARTVIGPV